MSDVYETYHGIRVGGTKPKPCRDRCSDPLCNEVGCLNQPAWKLRGFIMLGLKYAKEHEQRYEDET